MFEFKPALYRDPIVQWIHSPSCSFCLNSCCQLKNTSFQTHTKYNCNTWVFIYILFSHTQLVQTFILNSFVNHQILKNSILFKFYCIIAIQGRYNRHSITLCTKQHMRNNSNFDMFKFCYAITSIWQHLY